MLLYGPPAQVLPVLDTAKEDDASEGIEEHEEEHSHDDEEGLEHGHHHRQHQHLQSGLEPDTLGCRGAQNLGGIFHRAVW